MLRHALEDMATSQADDLTQYIYYSFITYTSLGFGNLMPTGTLRFLTGLKALTGLLLITWTASFMYMKMQQYWETT